MFKQRTTREKLMIAFSLLGLFFGVMLLTAQLGLSQLHAAADTVANQGLTQLRLGQSVQLMVQKADDDGSYYLLTGNTSYFQRFQSDVAQVNQLIQTIRSYPLTSLQHQNLTQFDGQWASYLQGDQTSFTQYNQGDLVGGQRSYANTPPDPVVNAAATYVQSVVELVNHEKQAMQQTSTTATILVFGISGLAILTGIGLVLALTRALVPPLQAMVAIAQRIADGDLADMDAEVARYASKDETGTLIITLQHMVSRLRQTVQQLHQTSHSMASASHQIASAAEQTGGAVSQVAQAMQQVAQGAQEQNEQLADAAQRIGTLTGQGTKQQQQAQLTVQAMTKLKASIVQTATQVESLGERSNQVDKSSIPLTKLPTKRTC